MTGREHPSGPMNQAPKLSFSCPVAWESMSGDDARRFCEKCQKHVHNLSVMPAEERRVIFQKVDAGEHLCVSYLKRADCEMVVPENTPSKLLRYGLAAGVAASALSLAACSSPTHPPTPTVDSEETFRTGGAMAPSCEPAPDAVTIGKVAVREKPPQCLTGDIAPAKEKY